MIAPAAQVVLFLPTFILSIFLVRKKTFQLDEQCQSVFRKLGAFFFYQ